MSELVNLCKRRRVGPKDDENHCAVATDFFQDNVFDAEDDEAFGTSAEVEVAVKEAASETECEDETEEPEEPKTPEEPLAQPDFEDMVEAPLEEVNVPFGEEGEEEIEVEADEAETDIDISPEVFQTDPTDSIQQPRTPDEPLEDSEEERGDHSDHFQPMHRTCVPTRSSLRSDVSPNVARPQVTFMEMNVADSYLLDDPTGLKELIHVENFRFHSLWYHNPGAAVQCGWCQRDWPQAFGKLHGEEGRSQFAQTDFVCNECLLAAEEAWKTWQAQKEAEAKAKAEHEPEPSEAEAHPSEMSGTPTGPWDNPGSGWNDWAGD